MMFPHLLFLFFVSVAEVPLTYSWFSSSTAFASQTPQTPSQQQRSSHAVTATGLFSSTSPNDLSCPLSVDQALQQRYACTRFERFDGCSGTVTTASTANSTVVELAFQALQQARRAPSGFNVQPYKLLLVSSPKQKELLAQYCIGHNAHRVRDSDCTVLFLADREAMRDLRHYRQELLFQKSPKWKENRFQLLKIQALVALFSQGFPLPQWISQPLSWGMRFGVRVVSWLAGRRLVVPTLSSAETWSQKNTMLVAMAYLLGCTSRGLATCPMEGYLSWGIRRNLKIPRRYTIPLIVATGIPYKRPTRASDDAGMTHGASKDTATLRYPLEQLMFHDSFGRAVEKALVPGGVAE